MGTRSPLTIALLAVPSTGGPVFDFALSAPWVYFVTASGLYRVRI